MEKLLKRAASAVATLALGLTAFVGFAAPADALAGCRTSFDSSATIRKGSDGQRARAAQCLLKRSGYAVAVDGSFSARDAAKTRAFQRKHDLRRTGTVNPTTWRALVRNVKHKHGASHSSAKAKVAGKGKGKGKGGKALAFAKRQLGDRYRYGGNGPNAWDCSGLTRGAWRASGVSLPHSSRAQFHRGKKVSKGNLRKGDLVFFYSGISHVGIYAGKGKIIHASRPGKPVGYIKMKYMPYKGARRPG